MIYSRDEEDNQTICNFNLVMKGFWKLSIEEHQEEFIYKKTDFPQSEDLLEKLYCEDPSDRVEIPDLSKATIFDIGNS